MTLDNSINDPKSIKYYVKRYFDSKKEELYNKKIIDVPAGNGTTSQLLFNNGAEVHAFDLFPEYFMQTEIKCKRADIMEGIPVADKFADWLICQEGIEHFSDQLKGFKEFNRVLKENGTLVITAPSYSNLANKFSYLLFESENNKQMPPNEIDDIWMSDQTITKEIYHGHIFLIGLQKLRILAKLAGFDILEIKYLRISKGSLALFPFFYPLIFISSYFRYFRNLKKHKEIPLETKKKVYKEQLQININPKNLINHHTFIVFKKVCDFDKVDLKFDSIIKPFSKIM